jgi:hypothetical protein
VDIVFKQMNEPIPELPEELAKYQSLLDKMTAKDPGDRFADAGEMVAAVTELRVNDAVGGLNKEGRQKHRRKTDDKPKTSRKAKLRLALVAVLALACGLVYVQRSTVVPFVESYTGPLADERGVMVDQKDSAVGHVLGWWQHVAPYFSWKAADPIETKRIRCHRQGRPDCDARFPLAPPEDTLADNVPPTTQ